MVVIFYGSYRNTKHACEILRPNGLGWGISGPHFTHIECSRTMVIYVFYRCFFDWLLALAKTHNICDRLRSHSLNLKDTRLFRKVLEIVARSRRRLGWVVGFKGRQPFATGPPPRSWNVFSW